MCLIRLMVLNLQRIHFTDMKIRNDFVSNSSSSSFIVEGGKKNLKKITTLLSELPWNLNSNIYVNVISKDDEESKKTLYKEFYPHNNMIYGNDWHTYVDWGISCEPYRLEECLKDHDVVNAIKEVSISTESSIPDTERAIFKLVLLYFKKMGVKISGCDLDSGGSAFKFIDDMMSKLMGKKYQQLVDSVS